MSRITVLSHCTCYSDAAYGKILLESNNLTCIPSLDAKSSAQTLAGSRLMSDPPSPHKYPVTVRANVACIIVELDEGFVVVFLTYLVPVPLLMTANSASSSDACSGEVTGQFRIPPLCLMP